MDSVLVAFVVTLSLPFFARNFNRSSIVLSQFEIVIYYSEEVEDAKILNQISDFGLN